MDRPDEELVLDLDPQALGQMARLIADAFVDIASTNPETLYSVMADVLVSSVTNKEIATYNYGVIGETVLTLEPTIPKMTTDEAIKLVSLDLISSATAGVLDPLGQLRDWFVSILNSIASFIISGITSFIEGGIKPLFGTITSGLQSFINTYVIPAISGVVSAITGFISNTLVPAITSVPSAIMNFISSTVVPAITGLSQTVSSLLAGAVQSIASFINTNIIPAMNMIGSAISNIPSTIMNFISNTVVPAITGGINSIMSGILSISQHISGFISNTVVPAIISIPQVISGLLSGAVQAVTGFINTHVIPAISNVASTIGSAVQGFISTVMRGINSIITYVSAGFQSVANIFTGFINAITTFPQWFPKWFMETIAKPISDALSRLGNWIWEALPYWFKNILTAIGDFFTKTLPEGWNAFVNGIKAFVANPLEFIKNNFITPLMDALKSIGNWIWEALPDWLKDALKGIGDFLTKGIQNFIDGLQKFTKDPWGWLQQNIIEPIIKGANWLVDQAVKFGNMLWDGIQKAAETIYNVLSGAFSGIITIASNFFNMIYQGLVGIARSIGNVFKSLIEDIQKTWSQETVNLIVPTIEKVKSQFGIRTPEFLTTTYIISQMQTTIHLASGMLFLPLFGQFIPRILSHIARTGGKFFEGLGWTLRINLRPIGIGIDTTFDVGKALGAALYTFAEEWKEWLNVTGLNLAYAISIPVARPLSRLVTYTIRDLVPVELPPQSDIIEFARRNLPNEKMFKEFSALCQYYLALYGYSDVTLSMYFAPPELYSIKIRDRFEQYRTVPLSLIYELPSASDVASMMVRDIFSDIEEFNKLYQARGMHKDIGALYYMLRFKYPPPEKLWQYTTRGISGLLWARITSDEMKRIADECSRIGAYMPLDSASLNASDPATRRKLLEAFSTYMKWHDYARFSWIQGFTSDNQIMTDVQADIPTKIDLRWMARFGIFEHMSKMGVTINSPIDELRKLVLESSAKSNIVMDLTQFSRFIQATGMHPDLVPIVAVAETINAIADERTLLRTATLNLFKEGFWDTSSIERMLEGAITTSFNVAVFDVKSLQWENKYINMPLMFLPPERKLTEIRALADRAVDILREIQRDVTTAYQENIITSYDGYKDTLTKAINMVNEFFAKDFEAITGTKLPEELKLKFVEAYYKPYIQALETFRSVYVIRRLRAWTQRWLGWIMYRVATGVASLEDTEQLIKVTAEKAMLTTGEVEFLQAVMKIMYRIASREYVPTPSQLLTMSEYVSIPGELVDKVFQARFMPPEWAGIWKHYISVRTIADDVKGLISSYLYVSRYVKVPDDIVKTVMDYASKIGFGADELNILRLRADLEELLRNSRENAREYIPSPSMLASMAEYLPEVRDYYDDVIRAKGIPETWQALWAKYIDIRPLVDEVKKYLSRAEQLYARFMIPEEEFMSVLNQVKNYLGYTDKEIEFILLTSRYERHRTAWTELIGDVDRMVMLAEYSPKARDFALGTLYKMIDALPIEPETKKVLKEMWEQFIHVKPVMEEVKRYVTDLINAYVDGVIGDQLLSSELEALKKWGLDDYEIMFYKAMAGMRKARKLKITIG